VAVSVPLIARKILCRAPLAKFLKALCYELNWISIIQCKKEVSFYFKFTPSHANATAPTLCQKHCLPEYDSLKSKFTSMNLKPVVLRCFFKMSTGLYCSFHISPLSITSSLAIRLFMFAGSRKRNTIS